MASYLPILAVCLIGCSLAQVSPDALLHLDDAGLSSSASHARRRSVCDSPVVLALDAEDQQQIVDKHNDLRRLNGAANTMKLSWSDDIAEQAQRQTDTCMWAHLSEYTRDCNGVWIGQNLGQCLGSDITQCDWTRVVQQWFDELPCFDEGTNSCTDSTCVCGHYTAVVWAKSMEVGCGATYCSESNRFYLACSYREGPNFNMATNPVYLSGAACSACDKNSYGEGKGYTCEDDLCVECDATEAGCEVPCTCPAGAVDAQSASNCAYYKANYNICNEPMYEAFAKQNCAYSCFCDPMPASCL